MATIFAHALAQALSLGRKWLLFAVAVAALACVQFAGGLTPLDNGLAALRATLVQREPSHDIVVVEIDAASLRAAGQWPWPRERYAQAITNLRAAGAELIGFDVDFSLRSRDHDDEALRAAIDAAPGAVVLPTFIQAGSTNEPLPAMSQNAVLASVNIPVDRDGIVRHYPRGFYTGGQFQPSMGAVLAGTGYGQTASFQLDYGIRTGHIGHLSFEDVYRGRFDAQSVSGKAVLIGATALELGDEFATPHHPSYSGVYLHALGAESLRQGRALLEANPLVRFLLGCCALALLWPRRAELRLSNMFTVHALILVCVVVAPIALQALSPVSLSLGAVIAAQGLCIWVGVHQELSRRAAALIEQREAHLKVVALHDPETRLPNRRALLEDLTTRLASEEKLLAVVAIGVDRFATLRAAIGYQYANATMEQLSTRLARSAGENTVYHLSTSTLAVVISASDEADARRTCARILDNLDTTTAAGDQLVDTSVRLGAAISLTSLSTPEKLLEQASVALDQARIQNRRHYFYDTEEFDPKMQFALLSNMAKGLERGEFKLVYQAKSSTDGTLAGAEALMRWTHPLEGSISPARFILMAEETGAIDRLTRWALQQVIEDQAELRARGLDLTISVNISGRCLCDASFCDFAIEQVRLAGASLCFEITETAIIDDPLVAMATIAALRAANIRISIDDYGSGLSSLAYLKQIQADELKLDKALIQELGVSTRDRLILKSTVDLAHGLGLTVVAEGVEDRASAAILASIGCDHLQGYGIAHPLPLQDFIAAYGDEERFVALG
ncbi:putative bifunctional diguanylate cyclase/phosphodiesterase [Terricaulis sp.]|uniref:putative bifunctional diguanylate cyclase/phosphodiesterase n=1 Tax=Terricaulis sp. TaxID=2768686 RepID=UPI003782FF10